MQLPTGVTSRNVPTARLQTHILEHGDPSGTPVLLIHGNVSSNRFFDEVLAAMPANFYAVAPDLRGYGESDTKPVDATRGVRDWSEDIEALIAALGLSSKKIHLLGWSLAGGIVLQYAIDHAQSVASLTLIAPVSPYGFGGTKGTDGQLVTEDGAGTGGGAANPDFVRLLANQELGSDNQVSPRNVMNAFYFKPPFRVAAEVEDRLVASMNSTAVGEDNYPGDMTTSSYWPGVAAGNKGVLNSIVPTHFNVSRFAEIEPKLPVLWIRGDSDQIVSDTSFFDLAFLGSLGAIPGWPGAELCPPQPMIAQTRAVLDRYQANGGLYREVVFQDCGHSPHVEKQEEFLRTWVAFLSTKQ